MPVLESLQDTLGSLLGGNDDTDQTEEQEDEQPAEGEDPDVDDETDDGGGFGLGDDEEEEDLEEKVADLEYELDEKDDEIQRLESAIESLQNNQEEVGDELDDVNDRIRKLLSIYDKVKESDNPFTGSKPQTSQPEPEPNNDDDEEDDDAFTLEDIENAFDSDDEDDADPDPEPEPEPQNRSGYDSKYEGVMDDERFLTYPPLTYAGEVVAFDWLAYLMDEAGAAGTLKALNYYEEIDWLSPDVRDYMVTLLSAPGVDVNAEVQKVEELSTDTHKESFRYIMKVSSVNQEYVIRNHER